ncbi:MAG: ABC transporter permease [Verrucomicrobiota bacterium]
MKLSLHLALLALKQIARHRLRSILAIASVAVGIFLFTTVEIMQQSLRVATETGANDTTLVVYQKNRFCPMTSRLPEHYLSEIKRIDGVREVIPIQILVNNCGASLDVITFRGVPADNLTAYNPDLEIIDGSYQDWLKRGDGALIGENFAMNRRLSPGDQFDAVGVRVHISGIVRSDLAQDNNVAYVHLPFLQQSSHVGLGVVTQFNVRVDSPDLLDPVAAKIDELFRSDAQATITRPEKAFFAQTAKEMIELINFTRWLGIGAVIGVLALVANALLLSARGRVRENAVLQTLGFKRNAIGILMIWEGIILGLAGGAFGSLSAGMYYHLKRFTLGNEGLTLAFTPKPEVVIGALAIAVMLGIVASLVPALIAATKPVVNSLRA